MSESYRLLHGDALTVLQTLPSESVHCVVTSPPYFGLRSYLDSDHADKALEVGAEDTPDLYVARLVDVFREVRRVLHSSGVVFLNLGDSYNNRAVTRPSSHQAGLGFASDHLATSWADHTKAGKTRMSISDGDLKEKDLIGIPWMTAFALRADGWYLRQDLIWNKTACMPESVQDRCTKSHEYLFLLAKSRNYYYDNVAIMEPLAESTANDPRMNDMGRTYGGKGRGAYGEAIKANGQMQAWSLNPNGRNKRSVWTLGPESSSIAHFAVMPTKLAEPCILAGSSAYGCCEKCLAPYERITEKEMPPLRKVVTNGPVGGHGLLGAGALWARFDEPIKTTTVGWAATCTCGADVVPCTVLDPFSGSGTTGVVALKHGRNYIGCELNADYIKLSHERIGKVQPMLLEVR